MTYTPDPIDTADIELKSALSELIEHLAKNNHDHWALQRLTEGWRYGPQRDDKAKTHPDLRPYQELPDSEKEYDRISVVQTLKAIIALGYRIEKD
jgi:hypothetical protein